MLFGADRESSKRGSPAELVGNLVNLPTNSPELRAEKKKIQQKNNTRRIDLEILEISCPEHVGGF